MFKGALGKIKCQIGVHSGDWGYPAQDDCTLVRVCERCSKVNRRIEHRFAEWTFAAVGRCEQQRRCLRCPEVEDRVTHSWSIPDYRNTGSCEQVQRCERCQQVRAAPPVHSWNAAAYVENGKCDQQRTCERCHAFVSAGIEHDWGDWTLTTSGDGSARSCRRCGRISQRPVDTTLTAPLPDLLAVAQRIPTDPGSDAQAVLVPASPAPTWTPLLDESGRAVEQVVTTLPDSAESTAESARSKNRLDRDSRLLDRWHGTDFLSSSGRIMVTDLHLDFAADGTVVYTRQSSGPAVSPLELAGEGTWSTSAGKLELRWIDGSSSKHRYYAENGNLLFPDENSWPRIWNAV